MTNSQYVMQALTERLESLKDRGWDGKDNKEWFLEAIETLQEKKGDTVKWVKG
ncbi:hypothetical protein AN958_01337 [Leucoagaricus sp. SymC.cos]|nr:hypothetical protein AN958_01337 [Leucoagaricus sp. SymC.cos]